MMHARAETAAAAIMAGLLAGAMGPAGGQDAPRDRYFFSGDGVVMLTNAATGESKQVRYRLADGSYPAQAQQELRRLFAVPARSEDEISLRLISLLDYVEDRYRRPLVVLSGYRSPEYNDSLRAQGRLAARTSLHTEGMAADIRLGNALSRRAFEEIKTLDCCGVGYYHGDSLHLDTGPSRFWDETTSKVDTDISARNQRIMASTDRDVYLPGESVQIRLARITDYPVGVSPQVAVMENGEVLASFPLDGETSDCRTVADRAERVLHWTIPASLRTEGKLQIRVGFCSKRFPEMSDFVDSNPIVIVGGG